jgi:tripartite-type tricarboxylate transporter receptor subunit TctC
MAKPDGYTLLMGAGDRALDQHDARPGHGGLQRRQGLRARHDGGRGAAHDRREPGVPAASLQEFVALAKAKPNTVTVASAGNGTTQHLGSELFKLMTKTQMVHIPYKGSGPAISDLLGGQVDATFETGPAALAQVKAGKLRVLATATAQRILPETPTASEAGVAGFEVAATYGVLAPAGTPKPVVDRLNAEIGKALAMPDVKAKFEQQGVIPMHMTPEQTTQHIRGEVAKWARVIKEANVKSD